MKFIPHSKSFIRLEDIDRVKATLERNYVGPGREVQKLENHFRTYLGRRYNIAVNSGSNALKLSILALQLKENSEIATSIYVCPAVVNVILELGYVPRFIDVARNDVNIDLEILSAHLQKNRKIRAVIIPYIGGYVSDISRIANINVPIIEDCAASIGAEVRQKAIGRSGILSVFSFSSTKMVTGGSGGMISSDSKMCHDHIRKRMDYDRPDMLSPLYTVAFNCAMNDLQAALALSQIRRLSRLIARRRRIARKYESAIRHGEQTFPVRHPGLSPSYYRFVFFARQRDSLFKKLRSRGIDARKSVAHLMYNYFPLAPNLFPEAQRLEKEVLSIPIYPNLTRLEETRIIAALKAIS